MSENKGERELLKKSYTPKTPKEGHEGASTQPKIVPTQQVKPPPPHK